MPALTSILAGASAVPGIFGVAKDIFGGGGDDTGGSTGYASVDPQAQKFNQYMMNYMQEKMQQPHQFRPVPEMPYNIMNMVSQAYGMGPYKDPGWQQAGGGPGAMGGMPRPQASMKQLQAPGGGGQPPPRRNVSRIQ